jgi:iron complex transport system permease protein
MTEGSNDLKSEYHACRHRCLLIVIGLIVAMVLLFFVGLSVSQYPIGFLETYQILIDHIKGVPIETYDQWMKDKIVVDMNMPRILGGITVGIILAVGGAIMQPVIKNPIADPFTTGISSGALLGVSIYLAYGISIIPAADGDLALMINAFLFALIPTAAIVGVTLMKKTVSPTMMVLTGIGVMYMFSAISSLVRYNADPDAAHAIFSWTLGTLGRVTWDNVYILIAVAAFSLIFGMVVARSLNIIMSGDNLSKSLGLNVKQFRALCMIVVALITGITVAFTGTIGFVGLVCPHIARIIVGSNNRYVIPCSALIGMIMLVGSDCVSKVITTSGLPVGAVTALIGSPIFIYLLAKQRNKIW